MNISPENHGHAALLDLKGELTQDVIDDLRKAVDRQLESEDVIDVLLNLEKVPFVDSAALEYLLDLQDRLAQRLGQVKLVRPDENVRKILEMTRLLTAFEVFDDVAEAVKAIRA